MSWLKAGKKKFDLRVADFDTKESDTLVLEEWNPKTAQYTGRKNEKTADYVLRLELNDFGQEDEIKEKGVVVIQLSDPN